MIIWFKIWWKMIDMVGRKEEEWVHNSWNHTHHTPISIMSYFINVAFYAFNNFLSLLEKYRILREVPKKSPIRGFKMKLVLLNWLPIKMKLLGQLWLTLAFPCLTQRIPSLDPSLVWITRTRPGPDKCWITSAADDYKKIWCKEGTETVEGKKNSAFSLIKLL